MYFCFCCVRFSFSVITYYWPAYWASIVLHTVVCNARGWSAAASPGTWPVWWPTLHGGTVRLLPVRATPC